MSTPVYPVPDDWSNVPLYDNDGWDNLSFCSVEFDENDKEAALQLVAMKNTDVQHVEERYTVIICITELYMITVFIMVCCLLIISKELLRPQCGVMDHVDKLRVSLRMNPPELPKTHVYK